MRSNRMTKMFWYLQVIPKLGVWNVIYVFYYRLLLKSGSLQRKNPIQAPITSLSVFKARPEIKDMDEQWSHQLLEVADKVLNGKLPYYFYHWMQQSIPPNWFLNPFNGAEFRATDKHWSRIADFNSDLGDIKNIWEPSRFSWLGILARAYAVSGKVKYLHTLNSWLHEWLLKNPGNQGPNWKCGQEASFRVLNLLNAAHILGQFDDPSQTIVLVIKQHLKRIASNIRYAEAQRNNHATSEAAALYIGGNWLLKVSQTDKKDAKRYAQKGRSALEKLSGKLTYDDGSFAQHSVIYHRLFLDTLSTAIFWTHKLRIKDFSQQFYTHAEKSMQWLLSIMDESGSCPNLGPNDGTLLLANHGCGYRDVRPSLQTASSLIKGRLLFDEGPYDEALHWFDIDRGKLEVDGYHRKSRVHNSGYVVMNCSNSWAMLRFPNYKFRPSHNDVFHFDLWSNGKNILFDSGSYSYNPDKGCTVPDLKSVKSHNTLSFDSREQMPRLGRFLLGKWIKSKKIGDIFEKDANSGSWQGSYVEAAKNSHTRTVSWDDNTWEIVDEFAGEAKEVEIGFNFDDCEYLINCDANKLELPWGQIIVSDNAKISVQRQIVSNFYFQVQDVYRLVLLSPNNDKITTLIKIF